MITFTIPGEPIGKPRMTQRDKWARRPCVLAYRAWADKARLALFKEVPFGLDAHHKLPTGLYEVSWLAYVGMTDSWPAKKKARLKDMFHFGKPDRDNIDKALLDSIFADDRGACTGRVTKRWDDGQGPRLVVTIIPLLGGEMP